MVHIHSFSPRNLFVVKKRDVSSLVVVEPLLELFDVVCFALLLLLVYSSAPSSSSLEPPHSVSMRAAVSIMPLSSTVMLSHASSHSLGENFSPQVTRAYLSLRNTPTAVKISLLSRTGKCLLSEDGWYHCWRQKDQMSQSLLQNCWNSCCWIKQLLLFCIRLGPRDVIYDTYRLDVIPVIYNCDVTIKRMYLKDIWHS